MNGSFILTTRSPDLFERIITEYSGRIMEEQVSVHNGWRGKVYLISRLEKPLLEPILFDNGDQFDLSECIEGMVYLCMLRENGYFVLVE